MSGTCIGLVSGGIDSPVAIARMAVAGWKIIPIHFSMEPVAGPEGEKKCIDLLLHLKNLEGGVGESVRQSLHHELVIVPVIEILNLFTEDWNHKEYFIHMKRLFNAIATLLAEQYPEATHVLTGENLGQVSSQTLSNLGAIQMVTPLKPLRPLLGIDKIDIMSMARSLGTLKISEGPEVCDALGPSNPATVANREWLEKSEARNGDLDKLAEKAFSMRRIIQL